METNMDDKDGTMYPDEYGAAPKAHLPSTAGAGETPQEAPQAEPAGQGIGDMMKEGTRKAIAAVVVLLIIVAYLGGLAYAEVHGLNMLRSGVAPDLLMWAYIGMVSLGMLAIALPLGLHFWAFDPLHRIAMFIFYGVDLALLGVNTFTDFNVNEGQQLVQWAQFYKDYIVPATPVIAMLMATVLLLLDPHARAFVMRQALRAAMMQKQADLIMKAANNPSVTATVDIAAQREVEHALSELFGYRVTPADGYILHKDESKQGLLNRFFGFLSSIGQRVLSDDSMLSPSRPPSSEDQEPPQV